MTPAKILFGIALTAYLAIVFPFASHLRNRPIQVKLGHIPSTTALQFLAADQRYLIADSLVLKVIFYFGELLEKAGDETLYASKPDYGGMLRFLRTCLQMEPYNMDAYYFAQAVYVWDVGQVEDINRLLEYGMRYRTWDYQLPFFAGFNSAYFLKDYATAADYMQRAAELSSIPSFSTLASRYFHESGQDELAIAFLESMKHSARNEQEAELYNYRLAALRAAQQLQKAVAAFKLENNHLPNKLSDLIDAGYLSQIPKDPYGGEFYLDSSGQVKTTSDYSFAGARQAHEAKLRSDSSASGALKEENVSHDNGH